MFRTEDKQKNPDSNYAELIAVEFIGMLFKFLDNRISYHIYSVDKLCSQAMLLGYDYRYKIIDDKTIHKYFELGEMGCVDFIISTDTDSAIIADKSVEVITTFLKENGLGEDKLI